MESDVSVNINYLGFAGCNDSDSAEDLGGYDDWQHLLYGFTDTDNYADGAHVEVADNEITAEVVAEIYAVAADHRLYVPLTLRNH